MKNKKLAALLAMLLLIVFGISTALAAPANTTNTSKTISLATKVKIYKVYYHHNGGSGDVPTDENKYAAGGSAIVLDGTKLIAPSGKSFAGWATVADATKASYYPDNAITVNGDVNLYAVWTTAAPVKVTYHYGSKTNVVSYASGEEITLPTLESLGFALAAGEKFAYWGTSETASSGFLVGAKVKVTADTDYYVITGGTYTEFTATVNWYDAGNLQGSRPTPSEFLAVVGLKQDISSQTNAVLTISETGGDSWTLTWANLDADQSYQINPPTVEGYTLSSKSDTSLTYSREVGEVIMSMWITNKKWDKNGELIKFKAGQTVNFRIDLTNVGNTKVSKVLVWECLKNCKFKKGDGYKITSEGYAYVGDIEPWETVYVYATYRITNSDTRKEKVSNVAGVDFMRADGSWGDDWDAVRIPINKKSATSTTVTVTPSPTPVVTDYMVEKLLKDASTTSIAYPNSTIEVVGADQILTPQEYATYQTLNTQDKILTVLNTVGFEQLVARERIRLNLSVSETALNLMTAIANRKQGMTDAEKTAQAAVENAYFPKQSLTVGGVMQNYYEMALKVTTGTASRTDRYTFRQNLAGEWEYVRVVSEQ